MIRILAAIAAVIIGLRLASAGHPVMLIAGIVIAAILWVGAGTRQGAPAGRMVTGHSHGATRQLISRHEAGHAVAAEALGGTVKHAWMTDNEGAVHARMPDDPVKRVAFYRAGQEAVNSAAGCSADSAAIRGVLKEVPSSIRGQIKRDGIRLAKRVVASNRGGIRRYARRLDEEGRRP